MNADEKRSESPEAAVSRAIDDVLAAEKNAAASVASAVSAAENTRHQANEEAHRILARADQRIGDVHHRVAMDIRTQIADLNKNSDKDDGDTPPPDLDVAQLQALAEAVAEWLTTDADD